MYSTSKNYKTYKTFPHSHSENLHSPIRSSHLVSLIYGGIDGLFTSFSLLMAAIGIKLNSKVFLILNFSNIIGGAISMGFGDFLSSYAEYDLIKKEYKREQDEMKNYPKEEINEMIDIYKNKYQVPKKNANIILQQMFIYKKLFLDHMFNFELGLAPPEKDDFKNIILSSGLTFFSFIIFGSIPFITLLITSSTQISIGTSFMGVFILGSCKGWVIRENIFVSGIKLLILASLCGTISYYGAIFCNSVIS